MPLYMKDSRQGRMPPWLIGMVDSILGPGGVPTTPAVSVGPNSIPLDEESNYLKKVAGTTLDDLGSAARNKFNSLNMGAKNILGEANNDPLLNSKMNLAEQHPGIYSDPGIMDRYNPEQLHKLINHLANAFLPSYWSAK